MSNDELEKNADGQSDLTVGLGDPLNKITTDSSQADIISDLARRIHELVPGGNMLSFEFKVRRNNDESTCIGSKW